MGSTSVSINKVVNWGDQVTNGSSPADRPYAIGQKKEGMEWTQIMMTEFIENAKNQNFGSEIAKAWVAASAKHGEVKVPLAFANWKNAMGIGKNADGNWEVWVIQSSVPMKYQY